MRMLLAGFTLFLHIRDFSHATCRYHDCGRDIFIHMILRLPLLCNTCNHHDEDAWASGLQYQSLQRHRCARLFAEQSNSSWPCWMLPACGGSHSKRIMPEACSLPNHGPAKTWSFTIASRANRGCDYCREESKDWRMERIFEKLSSILAMKTMLDVVL